MTSDNLTTPPAIEPAPRPFIQLAPPPPYVTDVTAALRVACAQWMADPGSGNYRKEARVCDVVLGRDIDFPLGVSIGVLVALAVVVFVSATRAFVHVRTCGRTDNLAVFGILTFWGVIGGYVASWPLTWYFSDVWSDTECRLVAIRCIAGMVVLLAALRWNELRQVAA